MPFCSPRLEITLGAVVAGWIVGGRRWSLDPRPHPRPRLYGFVGWLVLVPLNVAGSTVADLQAVASPACSRSSSRQSGMPSTASSTGIYASVFLLPFGAGVDRHLRPAASGARSVSDRPARDPRRLGLGAAAIIAGYALVVAAISANATAGELRPPETVPAPVRLALLFLLPAAVAAIGAMRRSRPILVAAGVLCLAQSFVAFSGVTIPFLVPAFVLLALGVRSDGTAASRRARVGGVVVVLLGFAMWVAPFSLTETTCWVAETEPMGPSSPGRFP